MSVGRYVRHASRQSQRLGERVVQIDFRDALCTGFRQRSARAAPDDAEGVEARRHGCRTRTVRGQDLADQIQQQIELQLQAHQIGRSGGVVVALLGGTVLFHRIPRLQQPHVAVREGRSQVALVRVRSRPPLHGQHALECQLFVEDDGIRAIEHTSLHVGLSRFGVAAESRAIPL